VEPGRGHADPDYPEPGYTDPDYPEPGYREPEYTEAGYPETDYRDSGYRDSGHRDTDRRDAHDRDEPGRREIDYAEPRFEPIKRRTREPIPAPREERERPGKPSGTSNRRTGASRNSRGSGRGTEPANPLPFTAVAVIALIAASFVSPKAVAGVTAVLQATTVWAVLDLMSLPSRRAAVIATLPALAADAAMFAFRPDDSTTAVAAAIGCGFVLAALDTVFRTGRRGVQQGASRELAVIVTALLLACLASLFVAAGRLDHTVVAGGAVLAGLLGFGASRSTGLPGFVPNGSVSRSSVVGLSFTAAALASYGAAILLA
jgi:hypothetical protein